MALDGEVAADGRHSGRGKKVDAGGGGAEYKK